MKESEAAVERNNGEVAEFSDGGKINRQRPAASTATDVNYSKLISWDAFKYVFAVGLTKPEVNERLKNPGGSDGTPIGVILPTKTITTNQTQITGAQLGQLREKAKK